MADADNHLPDNAPDKQPYPAETAVTAARINHLPLVSQLDLDQALDAILEQVAQIIPYDTATIQLLEGPNLRVVRLRANSPMPSLADLKQRSATLSFAVDQFENLRQIIQHRQPLVISDTHAYPGWIEVNHQPPYIGSWVGAPLLDNGNLLGLMTLDKNEKGFYQSWHGEQLAVLANQATLALHNARLYWETWRQLEELHVLHTVATACTDVSNVDDLLRETTAIVSRKLYPDNFGFLLLDEEKNLLPHPSYHVRLSISQPIFVPAKQGITGWVARHGRVRRVPDVTQDPDYLPIDPHTMSELCVPLITHRQTIGVINAESIHPDKFTEADERLLLILSRQLAIIIEKIHLLDAERRRRQEAEILRDAMAALTSSLDIDRVLEQILVQLDKVVPNDTAALMLVENDGLCVRAANGFEHPEKLLGHYFPVMDPFLLEVQQSRQPIYLPDASADPRFQGWGDVVHVRGWICAPMVIHDRVLGVLTVDNKRYAAYGPADVALAQIFANQAAIAIENARLYAAEQSAHRTADILRTVNEALTQTLDADRVLETLLDQLIRVIPVDSACILLLDDNGELVRLHTVYGYDSNAAGVREARLNVRTNPTLSPIFLQGQSVIVPDTLTYPGWERLPATSRVRSWLGVPITDGGQVIGAFSLDKHTPRFFLPEHVRLAEAVTAQAVVALKNARLFAEAERRASELETIGAISAALRLTNSVEEIFAILLQQATAVAGGSFGSVYLMDAASGDLVLQACLPANMLLQGHRHRQGEGITGHVAAVGQLYISQNIWQDPLFVPFPVYEAVVQTLRASISLPLQTQDQVIGVLHIGLEYPHEFTRAEISLLRAIAEIAASALSRALLLETLEQRVARRTAELAEANERLQELDRLKTKFVSDVSHELRTPITNLSLYLDLLEHGRPERRAQYENVLRKQVDRLNTLIEDTLQLSRLDMGKTPMQMGPQDINAIVAECLAEIQPLAEKAEGVEVTAVLQPHLPPILGDKVQLIVVLQNLLQNALLYTRQGAIQVSTQPGPNNTVCVAVADTGAGIVANELPHIFERFYRGTAVSQSALPGTGLGLAIAKEIIQRHNGSIAVESEVGVGSTFTISLPVANEEQ